MTDLLSVLGDTGTWMSALGGAHGTTWPVSTVAALAVAAFASSPARTTCPVQRPEQPKDNP